MLGRSGLETGDDEADIEPLLCGLDAGAGATVLVPGLGLITGLCETNASRAASASRITRPQRSASGKSRSGTIPFFGSVPQKSPLSAPFLSINPAHRLCEQHRFAKLASRPKGLQQHVSKTLWPTPHAAISLRR